VGSSTEHCEWLGRAEMLSLDAKKEESTAFTARNYSFKIHRIN